MKYTSEEILQRLERKMKDTDSEIKTRIKAAKTLMKFNTSEYIASNIIPIFEDIYDNDEAYSIEAAEFLISYFMQRSKDFIDIEENI